MAKIRFSQGLKYSVEKKKRQDKNKWYKLINRWKKCQFSDINRTGH